MGGGRDLRGGFGVISPTIGTLDVPTTVHSSHGRAAEYDVLPENVGDGEGVSAEARLGSILTLMHPTESWELLHLRATLCEPPQPADILPSSCFGSGLSKNSLCGTRE